MCCSASSIDWHTFYTTGALIDVDTSKCGFEEPPKYFTELTGNSNMHRIMGASSIYSPTESGFRIYINEETLHTTPTSSIADSWRLKIKWCGVGKAKGPTVANVCCGTGPASWGRSSYEGGQNIDAKNCEMKGDPIWITAVEGAKRSGTDQFIGSNAGFSQGYRYSHMYIRKAYVGSQYWGQVGSAAIFNKGGADMLQPKFCLFGEPFPTGDMRINADSLDPDEYPCNGVRVIDDGKVVSNQAKICCGKSDTKWKQQNKFKIYKEIDTSECSFLQDDSNKVVYITSLGGKGEHQFVSGTTAYMTSSPTRFSMSLGSHKGTNEAWYAEEKGWYVNWCGIGKAGEPKPPPPPPVPPPPPNVPSEAGGPTTPAAEPAMPAGQKGINMDCSKWRDKTKVMLTDQMKLIVGCMQQDCEQSMETVSCRFLDPNGFCYTDSGQKWCNDNKPHSLCKDLGEAALSTNLGGKGAWAPAEDMATYGKYAVTDHFTCSCAKKCVFKNNKVDNALCDTAKGGPINVSVYKRVAVCVRACAYVQRFVRADPRQWFVCPDSRQRFVRADSRGSFAKRRVHTVCKRVCRSAATARRL